MTVAPSDRVLRLEHTPEMEVRLRLCAAREFGVDALTGEPYDVYHECDGPTLEAYERRVPSMLLLMVLAERAPNNKRLQAGVQDALRLLDDARQRMFGTREEG